MLAAGRSFVIPALIAAACGSGSTPTAPTPANTASPSPPAAAALPLGQASGGVAPCPSGSPVGAGSCMTLAGSCPSVTASALLRVDRPLGTTRGTLVLVSNGDGTLFPRARPYSPLVDGLIEALNADGVTVVELAWRPGLWGGPRARTRACGFATALRWIRDTVHETGPALFAAEGRGEGASQIAFALAHYGTGDYLDLAVLAAGPVLCPLCDAGGDGPAEPLLPHGVDSRSPLLEYARTSVRARHLSVTPNCEPRRVDVARP